MKILHYSLGLPPYRSGGLTRYSLDLMLAQVSQGQEVTLFFPGHHNLMKKRHMKKQITYEGIQVYELINPLPVSLLGGVGNPDSFMDCEDSQKNYKVFLTELNPDVIHVHTLMGLPQGFVKVAKDKGIKVIFTSHDYYGICPKVNLIDYKGDICNDYEDGFKCTKCNTNAYSLPLIYLMQSRVYRLTKNNELIKKFRAIKKQQLNEESNEIKVQKVVKGNASLSEKYVELRSYYKKMVEMMDLIHYNSEITKSVYEMHVTNESMVLPITHGSIQDNRRLKSHDSDRPLQIGFLGPLEDYKGFPLLRRSLLRLIENKKINWHLHVYGNTSVPSLSKDANYISFHGKYVQNQLETIFSAIDVLIIPSIWKETFGFIGLEAMAHGVPCIVSDTVGFKDMVVDQKTGLIIKANETELSKSIETLMNNRQLLIEFNRNICEQSFISHMGAHVLEMNKLYNKVLGAN